VYFLHYVLYFCIILLKAVGWEPQSDSYFRDVFFRLNKLEEKKQIAFLVIDKMCETLVIAGT